MRRAAQPGEAADGDISVLLSAWKNGDRRALEKPTPVTVMRDWSTAKAWLYRELAGGTTDGL